MRGDDVKTFYNIGSEKDWISSAMEDNQNKGKQTVCQLPDKYQITALQLTCNCLATSLQLPEDYLMTAERLPYDIYLFFSYPTKVKMNELLSGLLLTC